MVLALAAGCAHVAPIRVAAGGDLQLDGEVGDPLTRAAELLPGELRLANLEGPLTARGVGDETRFAAPPERAAWLRGRIEVASLANNHALDRGEAGRDDTVRALAANGVAAAYRGHDAIVVRGGRTVTIVAREFSPDADLDGDRDFAAAVRAAARRGPVLATVHWGHTGSLLPTAAQRRLAARLVDAGAAAVLGHGPHTLQGIERRGRGVVAYSLGNLAFGCRCTEVADAFTLAFTLAPDGSVTDIRTIPLRAGLFRAAEPSGDPGLRELIDTLSSDLAARPGG